ncbi:MAG: hydantoinase/oxoprolinase family protein [Acidimicrobiales bacterium]
MTVSVGVDVGGTFTDFVVFDHDSGRLRELKLASSGWAPAEAVVSGFRRLIDEGVDPGEIELFSHGTTVALNTLLQRSGARVGLLVTRGFRDVLQLRRLRLDGAPGFHVRQPVPLVPRRHVREVGGRLLADGSEIRPLDPREAASAAGELVANGCEAIAICLLHSYRNAAHESLAAAAIGERLPGVHLTLSSDVWPQQREYERTQVSVINAHVAPVMERYFGELSEALRTMGVRTSVLSTKSSGGVMSAARAARRPVETLLSGPASGVVAAAELGRAAGFEKVVAFDMGGTSADVGLVDGSGVRISTEATVGDFPLVMPSVDISSIGAGGGSIAHLDASGVLKVGPRSAGSSPGPAAYGRGGTEPTITDAYTTLGVLEELLGGGMRLDLEAAGRACGNLGDELGMDRVEAAESILAVATANMYSRILPLMAQRGADPRELALLAYGGAGPTHAFRLAREVGFTKVIVPPSPGTFCALGCLLADVRADFITTVYAELDRVSAREMSSALDGLRAQAEGWVSAESVAVDPVVGFSADMRYTGQSYELEVPLPDELGADPREAMRRAFLSTYARVYGYSDPEGRVEVVNIRAHLRAVTSKPPVTWAPDQGTPPAPYSRSVHHGGRTYDASVLARSSLRPGCEVGGPAVITQYDSTTFVPPDAWVEVDVTGNLVGSFR